MLLPAIRDVKDFIRRPLPQAIVERREVRRGVIRRAVRFLHERGHIHPLSIALDEKWVVLLRSTAIGEDTKRAIALACDATLLKIGGDLLEPRIVEALAERRIEANA